MKYDKYEDNLNEILKLDWKKKKWNDNYYIKIKDQNYYGYFFYRKYKKEDWKVFRKDW
jgi:hypothetical protein